LFVYLFYLCKNHHLNDFDRGQIIGMREAGLSIRDISQRVGRSVSVIVRIWSRWYESGGTDVDLDHNVLEVPQNVKIELFILV
jgi:hypothetical protein